MEKKKTMTEGKIRKNTHPKNITTVTLLLFASLLLLAHLPISFLYPFDERHVYAQQQTSTTTNPAINDIARPKLPEALVITDNARGDTQLPLRSSIINEKPIAELIASESGQGSLDEYFPIVTFHFKTSPAESKEASANVKHVLIGPVKSYNSPDTILKEANYWKDIPLNKKVALEIDHPGPHYLIASVQFANSTSGIYSGVMDVNALGIKPSSSGGSIQFKLDEARAASLEFTKMDQSDIEISESDPAFQLIASKIICSDLNNHGFEGCEGGKESAILENEENNDEDVEDSNGDDDVDNEVRGDGGKGRTYDINNCTGKQCEDADRETEQEKGNDDLPDYVPPSDDQGEDEKEEDKESQNDV
ncbi:MAG: hypothetical protein QN720_07875 [Nitrososphaeraceae archaeon]|nr:hypothetical protein [Nitrososphaeraceae archaeon]